MPKPVTVVSIPSREPPPELSFCRQSVETDIPDIEALQTPFTKLMFGEVDIKSCIEKRVCKTLVNACGEVVAFMMVKEHPNIPVMAHCKWIGWIRRYYRIDFASPWNTLFVHYLVWDPRYPRFFISFLKSLYKNNVKLEQILLVTPPGVQIFPELESIFTVVYPMGDGIRGSILTLFQNVHVNLRQRIISKLTVRKAGEEDNIDVQPLVHYQLDVLSYVFGEIKLGNIIDVQNPSKAVLVAEKGSSVTVGVLSATSKVDYDLIHYFFHHVLDSGGTRTSTLDRLTRADTVRSEYRRGLPFGPETIATDEQLSLDFLEFRVQSTEDDSMYDDDDRDELVVFWDEDGDMFRVVDPVMEYLLREKEGMAHDYSESPSAELKRQASSVSTQSADYPYWGRSSWSQSVLQPLGREDSCVARERVNTISKISVKDPSTSVSFDNAFAITLFALHPDLDVRYAYDILQASFECFPDKPFCLLYLPTAYQGSPLTKHMVRMAPKMSWDFPHELYITHSNAIFSEFVARPATIVDHVGIHELVENISQGKKISKDLTKMFLQVDFSIKGFVLECEGTIVGVAVITTNFALNQLQPHYKVDELVNTKMYDQESHGLIRHLVLCPVFLKSGPFFLSQIMHQAGLETLSYCMPHYDIINMFHIDVTPITVLGDMTPVLPKRRVEYDLRSLDEFTPQDHVVRLHHDYALFITTEKLLSIPKLELNYRIIVVGASNTALSFLENLIFRSARKHIIYNNLVLVSIHGFPSELRPHAAGDKMIPHTGVYTREHLSKIGLSSHVNVLYGALTVISRKEKRICLNSNHWLRYDYLFLMTGLQFCKPWPAADFTETKHESTIQTISCATDSDTSLRDDRDYPKQDCRRSEDIRELYIQKSEQYGFNIFVINTSADAVIALGHLKKCFKHKKEGNILIYGYSLKVYTCVESLLVFGVPGHRITLLIPPRPTFKSSCLESNPFVEETVLQSMETVGVTIHRGFTLICWSLQSNKYLDKVMFRNDDNITLTLNCVALFCYGTKTTSAKTYLAVSDAGIVYNNGIIIDRNFRTNDNYVYAAGPGTRYSNRYHPAQYIHHKFFNSAEIGLVMSKTFRRLVEPRKEARMAKKISSKHSREAPQPDSSENLDSTLDILPELKQPIIAVAQLPGGWNYVKVSSPGRPMPLECQFNGQGDRGPILITGVPITPDGPGYFQLSFSIYNVVREIVLLSKREIPYNNLILLYGKHERLLNHLYEQYNQGLISDFYSFFSQPWAYALFTARFDTLAQQCAEIFINSESVALAEFHSLGDKLVRQLRSTDQETISSRYLSSPVPMYVEHLTLRYISERPSQLPMYFTDAVLAAWHQSPLSSSTLHRDPAKLRKVPPRDS